MICQKCNHINTGGMKYCGACGTTITAPQINQKPQAQFPGGMPQPHFVPPPANRPMPPPAAASVHQSTPQAPPTPVPPYSNARAHHMANQPAVAHAIPQPAQSPQNILPPNKSLIGKIINFDKSQANKPVVSILGANIGSQVVFSALSAIAGLALFLPLFTLTVTFFGFDEQEPASVIDLLFSPGFTNLTGMYGATASSLFVALVATIPIVQLVTHLSFRFFHRPYKNLFIISLVVSCIGIIMPFIVWQNLRSLSPESIVGFDARISIGFVVTVLVYALSAAMSAGLLVATNKTNKR